MGPRLRGDDGERTDDGEGTLHLVVTEEAPTESGKQLFLKRAFATAFGEIELEPAHPAERGQARRDAQLRAGAQVGQRDSRLDVGLRSIAGAGSVVTRRILTTRAIRNSACACSVMNLQTRLVRRTPPTT